MELKDFVTSAITQISEAVKEADAKIENDGGLVNPGTHKAKSGDFVAPRTVLNFNIAVTAGEVTEGNAGGKVGISVISASLDGNKNLSTETASRLSFSIDVVLPHDPAQKDRVGHVRLAGKS